MNGEGWPERFHLFPNPLRYLGKLAREHPLDPPLEPVTDWPMESDGFEAEDDNT